MRKQRALVLFPFHTRKHAHAMFSLCSLTHAHTCIRTHAHKRTGAAYADKERVAEFAASGLLFKDNVEVTALDDPESE